MSLQCFFAIGKLMVGFGCMLKHEQPHPSPPLLSQGREPIQASWSQIPGTKKPAFPPARLLPWEMAKFR